MVIYIEKPKNNIELDEIRLRLPKTITNGTLKCGDSDDYWKVSFEEGVDRSSFNEDALLKIGDENHDFFDIKLVHTQWRYDFGFQTPLGIFMSMQCFIYFHNFIGF